MPAPVFDPTQYRDIRNETLDAEIARLNQQRTIQGYKYGTLPYEQAALDAQGNYIGAQRGVIQARMGTLPYQQAQNQANWGVLGANQASLASHRGLIGLEQQQLGAENLDIGAIRAARANVADKAAVATEGQARAVEDARYRKLGVEPPAEVDVQLGQEGSLPANLRPVLKTQEAIVRGKAADNAQDRAQTLEGAKLAVSLQDTNVTEAELAARKAGLSLADANLMVTQAEDQAALAGNTSQEAQLSLSQRKQGQAGLDLGLEDANLRVSANQTAQRAFNDPSNYGYEIYTNPDTGEKTWMTRREADTAQHAYEQQLTQERLPESVALNQQRAQLARQAALSQNPYLDWNPGDITQYLLPALPPSYPFSSNTYVSPAERLQRLAVIRQVIRAQNPGATDQFVESRVTQYLDDAKREAARLADQGQTTTVPSRPTRPGQ